MANAVVPLSASPASSSGAVKHSSSSSAAVATLSPSTKTSAFTPLATSQHAPALRLCGGGAKRQTTGLELLVIVVVWYTLNVGWNLSNKNLCNLLKLPLSLLRLPPRPAHTRECCAGPGVFKMLEDNSRDVYAGFEGEPSFIMVGVRHALVRGEEACVLERPAILSENAVVP